MGGLSSRNLLAMKIFAREFPDGPIAQQPVAQLPWGHVLQIMQRSKDPAARAFYIRETLAHGWSRDILETQIERQLYLRTGQAQNNFPTTQPPDESDLATQIFKDPYLFDFFVAGDAGQINLYRSAVDDLLRHPDDQPTIGLLLCKGKNKLVVEYALSGLEQSIAVADWKTQLTETLPAEFQGVLPTIEEIEAEFAGDLLDEKEEPHTKARSHEEEEEKP